MRLNGPEMRAARQRVDGAEDHGAGPERLVTRTKQKLAAICNTALSGRNRSLFGMERSHFALSAGAPRAK
jgi:hypothetical protein